MPSIPYSVQCQREALDKTQEELAALRAQIEALREALVCLVGCDGRAELEQMEIVLRLAPAPAEDKAAAINGIRALLATLPSPAAKDSTL